MIKYISTIKSNKLDSIWGISDIMLILMKKIKLKLTQVSQKQLR